MSFSGSGYEVVYNLDTDEMVLQEADEMGDDGAVFIEIVSDSESEQDNNDSDLDWNEDQSVESL